MQFDKVILVDDNDQQLGVMNKLKAHQLGLLHRAFSVFVFNSAGNLLLQRRSKSKYHSAGLWSNTCCSHPQPGHSTIHSAIVRLEQEMGIKTPIHSVHSFKYKVELNSELIEHEVDHVFTGIYDGSVKPDPNEVMDYKYLSVSELEEDLDSNPENYTAWFAEAYRGLAPTLV